MATVLITTSGIGSRLGDFTKHTNKALVRVGDKPAISHIVESYCKDTDFVITLGHFGAHIKEFLEIAYPNRKFEWVYVNKFEGEGSSLLYSMLQAESLLQKPFIFHTSDTIVENDYFTRLEEGSFKIMNHNFILGAKTKDHSQYASFDAFNNNVIKMHKKGESNTDYTHIGVVGIKDYEIFWRNAQNTHTLNTKNTQLSDVDVLTRMINNGVVFKSLEATGWHDVGNIDKLNETRKHLSSSTMHVLDKLGESIFNVEGYVVKFFADRNICKNRVERVKYLNGTVPEITASSTYFYKYPYVQGELFANVVNRQDFKDFLKFAKFNLWINPVDMDRHKQGEILREFYYDKTLSRLNAFLLKRNIKDKEEIINGERVPSAINLIAMIDFNIFNDSDLTSFHGDFILDNVIKTHDGFKLIDWRQDFAGYIQFGDKYYDLAKLAHNLVVNHGIIDNNNFSVSTKNDEIYLNIHRLQTLVECEEILFNVFDPKEQKKIKILRSIIWLNMSALHHHPFDLFLYYFGRYTLNQILQDGATI
jgi:NDP-sugar pyrophosphorylase family protein